MIVGSLVDTNRHFGPKWGSKIKTPSLSGSGLTDKSWNRAKVIRNFIDEDTFIKNLQETYGGRLSASYLSELSKSKGSQ